ncbi:chorismate-binding protein [Spirosoma sp. SC4-14]|uniref:chorismate-binding protein n=1 Tax=Spirosoma sp. SC4-14 TaxID=3128900 RepID=UPI0030CB8D90
MQSDSVSTIVSSARSLERRLSPIDFWETALTLGLPAALWRLPNQHDKHLIVSFDETLPRVSADLEELPAGFLVSPFNNLNTETETPANTLFIRADVQAVFSDNQPGDFQLANNKTGDLFKKTLLASLGSRTGQPQTAQPPVTLPDNNAEQEYIANVAEAVEAMRQGAFRKVVLSRTKQLQFTDAPNAVLLFDKLCQRYPTAFVSAVSIPEKGQIWISATPERLVSVDAHGIFRTNSLAGTQPSTEADGTPKKPSEAMWSQKEIEEQAIVSRYIIECFKKIRLREYVEEGPKTIIAGNLMHLGTSFTVDTQAVRYPQLGTVMLRLLHPTSAVCGMPRDVAFDFIRQHEPHDRELYSGFLGPVNINPDNDGPASDLFVHIRCMKLEGSLATLYAGAGLTEYSDPRREWQETEIKCQTLLAVISEQPTARN